MPRSLEKVRAFAEAMIAERVSAAMAPVIAPLLSFPDTDEECDAELERYARLCLLLRSDDAPRMEVVLAGAPVPSANHVDVAAAASQGSEPGADPVA